MSKIPKIKWLVEPEDHNYPAALSYLSLIYNDDTATEYEYSLRHAPMTEFKAKDIFRASRLSLLGNNNSHIEKNKKKINEGDELSPLLLIRDEVNGKVVIADGYHRLCAVYLYNEDAIIPCKIV